MRLRTATIAALAAAVVAIALALIFGEGESKQAQAKTEAAPGTPSIEIISPRNGARQSSHAVVVKVDIENFTLAPLQFGNEPQLGQGHVRYSLNRVPDCVEREKLLRAVHSPVGSGRLIGASMDYPEFSGPNGVLAEELGTASSYSPGTRPEIYYHNLNPGFYRLVVTLAQNSGAPTAHHAVTNFQVLPKPGHGPKPCPKGKIPSAKAAAQLR
ncbi:MAG TPA: hypothetical protein VFB52_09875 [Solirubrobacterales bacterium]|nr:hypothetical protein [Solirubrobacterales bacterium]